jgi:hypothetical protein
MHDILVMETAEGFLVQGLAPRAAPGATISDSLFPEKETLTFLDEDIDSFREEALARRTSPGAHPELTASGRYERALRVLGAYVDQQGPRDLFFFEQEGAYVLRLMMRTQAGPRHVLVEFTRVEIDGMVEQWIARRPGRGAEP